ncbi:MAG: hypothetical protein BWY85_00058 [Firmicutes bacterium ADurb.Bin506]|nr:MAG: hypothetical protein BWY85_00058 [Firmicutes bacterium ADurb.Bin506]
MALPPDIAAHIAAQLGGGRRRRKPKDSVMFPKVHTRRLLELVEEYQAKKNKAGYHQAKLDLWGFIRDMLPITRGKSCSINYDNARYVMIDIMGPVESHEPGGLTEEGDRILAAWEFPPERIHRIMELSDLDSASDGPLSRYELWDYLASFIPAIDENPGASFSIRIDTEWKGLLHIQRKDSDDDA